MVIVITGKNLEKISHWGILTFQYISPIRPGPAGPAASPATWESRIKANNVRGVV